MIPSIPKKPQSLLLCFDKLWNGEGCPDDRLWAQVQVAQIEEGLEIFVSGPVLHEPLVPDALIGTRVDGLWKYDVIELFLVGPGHQYLEIELGSGGHWLILGFDRIRHQQDAFETFSPIVKFEKTPEKTWESKIMLPWEMVPENLRSLNAFAILAGQHLAYSPVPGEQPDFHQPDSYPSISSLHVSKML